MFVVNKENKIEMVEKPDQPLLRSRDWTDVWHRGFMPQFSDVELQKIAAELMDERSPRLSKEIVRGCFFTVAQAAHKAVGKDTATWGFFDWLDMKPIQEVLAHLRGLVVTEIAKRKTDAEAKASDPGPEKGRSGNGGVSGRGPA